MNDIFSSPLPPAEMAAFARFDEPRPLRERARLPVLALLILLIEILLFILFEDYVRRHPQLPFKPPPVEVTLIPNLPPEYMAALPPPPPPPPPLYPP